MDSRGPGVGRAGRGCRALPVQDSLGDQGLILEFSKKDLLPFEDKLLVVLVRLHLKGFPYFTSK